MLANMRQAARWRLASHSSTNRRQRDDRGATLVEYALLIGLIAVVSIGSLVFLGQSTTRTFTLTGSRVSGTGGPGGGTVGDLGAPTITSAVGGPTPKSVTLTWTAPTINNSGYPIIGYDIFVGTSGGGENPNPIAVTGNTYTVTKLPYPPPNGSTLGDNTPYWFVIQAITKIGNGASSGEVEAKTWSTPGAPGGLTAAGGVRQVALTWTAPTDTGGTGATIIGYNVYEATSSGGPYSQIASNLGAPGYTATGLTDNTTYYFEVTAINQVGEGAPAQTFGATDGLPSAPTNLAASAADAQVTLSWTATPNSADGGSPVTSYDILQGTASGAESIVPVANTSGTSDTVTGLTNSVTYYFEVEAVNAVGVGLPSTEASATPVSGAPTAPTNLTATPGNARVALSWTAPTDTGGFACAYEYQVFQGTSAGQEGNSPVKTITGFLGGPPATNTTITPLTNDQPYFFTVKTVTLTTGLCTGSSSPASNEASATPGTPPAPTSLAATPGSDSVTLTWTAPTAYPNMAPVTTYYIFQGTSSGSEGSTPVDKPSAATACIGTACTDTISSGISNGTAYFFTVEAVNSVGASLPSNEASATPGAPGAPTNLVATAGDTQVSLTWKAPINPGASQITGYDIYMGTSAGGESTIPINGALVTGVSDTVTGLTDGTTYYFTVEAVNAEGNGPPSQPASATPVGLPGAPTGLTATSFSLFGTNYITLNWAAPTNTGGSQLTGFQIFEGTKAGKEGANPVDTLNNGGATTDTLNPFTSGTTYYFTVEAMNSTGSSKPSNEASALAGTTPAPTNLAAQALEKSVTLTWRAPCFGLCPVTGYDIYEGQSPGGESATPVNISLVTGTTYTVTNLTDGTPYYFTVVAVNAIGNSNPSNEASATPGTPNAPTNLTATAADGQVTLDWNAATVAPSAPSVTGYEVFEGTSSGGEASFPGDTVGNVTTDTITGLSNGTTYYFTVAAINSAGVGPASNEASAEPGRPPGAPSSVVATGGYEQVSLTWNPPSNIGTSAITSYEVFMGTKSGQEDPTPVDIVTGRFGNPPPTDDTIFNLNDGTTYYFTVEAVNSTGAGPANTPDVSATTDGPPSAPQTLTASAGPGNGQVSLSWAAPASTGGSPINGYTVLYGTSAGTLDQQANPNGTGTTYTVTGLAAGTPYYFEVEANNQDGFTSGPSNEVGPTTPLGAPGRVTGVTVTAVGNGSVSLSWTAPNSNPAISYYTVLWYSGNRSCANPSGFVNTPTSATSYQVTTGLNNGTQYSFCVEAVNSRGTGLASTPPVTATPVGPPGQVTGVTSTAVGNDSVTLGWTAPNNGGSPIQYYTIEYSTSVNMTSPTSVNTPTNATSYQVTGLQNVVTYYFEVEAVNANGNGALSSPSVSEAPGQATALIATGGTGNVALSWTAPATPGAPTSYTILYGRTVNMGLTASSPGAGTTFTVTGLANGAKYYFEVEAVDAAGNGPASAQMNATTNTVAGAPSAPTNLQVTSATCNRGACSINLSWTASATATQYQVFQSTSAGTENYSGTPAKTTTAPTTTANITNGITAGTTYFFTVVAVNTSGSSPPSTEVFTTPR